MYGITGLMGSGKSTVVDYLVKEYGFDEYAFAQPIKQIAMIMGFKHIDVYGTQEDKESVNPNMGISGREFLQKFGTEGMREMMPQILPDLDLGDFGSPWIKICDNYLKNRNCMNPIIISDMRFADEAAYLRDRRACLIKIIRPSNKETNHRSETEINSIKADITIINDGNLDNLYNQIDELFSHVFDKKGI